MKKMYFEPSVTVIKYEGDIYMDAISTSIPMTEENGGDDTFNGFSLFK